MNAKRFGSGFVAAIVAGFLATAAGAQPLNAEASGASRVSDPSLPLGDADSDDTPPVGQPAPSQPASPQPRTSSSGKQSYGIQWADHVSPSFRRWVDGNDAPVPATPPADPAIRNRPDAAQRASDLSTVENALDKSSADEPRTGGAGASTLFLKRASRAHARSIVGPEGALMGADLADGISLTPLSRSRSQGTLFDRQLPETGAAPKLATGPLPGSGPLQEIPAEERYDGTPLLGADAPAEPRGDDEYVVAVAKGELVGVELGDQVSVVHISQFAKGDRPAAGQLVVYPRSRHRPFGPINSFEYLNPFAPINVEPLQSAEDPSDPSPVARSAYAIGNWDTPGYVNLPLSDKSLFEFRDRLIADQRDPRNCCGPTRITVMHDPLALVILPNMLNSMPGQTFAIVPLAPGMRAW